MAHSEDRPLLAQYGSSTGAFPYCSRTGHFFAPCSDRQNLQYDSVRFGTGAVVSVNLA